MFCLDERSPENTFRLLLLLLRGDLGDAGARFVRGQLNSALHPDELCHYAHLHLVSGPIYENLKHLVDKFGLADFELAPMRQHALLSVASAKKFKDVLTHFQTAVLNSTGARHTHFKGPLLAKRYYDNPSMRTCRDLDILVASDALSGVLEAALDNNYVIAALAGCGCTRPNSATLRALIRYEDTISIIAPSGQVIELHQSLDKQLGVFDTEAALASDDTVCLNGEEFKVLPTSMLFLYICYHNTRHTWSRLHWLCDLSVFLEHSSFSWAEVAEGAEEHGLLPLVSACRSLNRLAGAPLDWMPGQKNGDAGQLLLDLAFMNLEASVKAERSRRQDFGHFGLPSPSLVSPSLRRKMTYKAMIKRTRPRFEEYRELPLPPVLDFINSGRRVYKSFKR